MQYSKKWSRRLIRLTAFRALYGTIYMVALIAPVWAAAQPVAFDIPAQPMETALQLYAQQAGLDVVFPHDRVRGLEAPALVGPYERGEALAILIEGSGLKAVTGADGAVAVFPSPGVSGQPSQDEAPPAAPQGAPDVTDVPQQREDDEEAGVLDEIIVTGTLIRGAQPVGAQLIIVGREEIERSGFATTAQVLQTLPQTLGAGPNEATLGTQETQAGAQFNIGAGAGVNLRGLGADKTLTLINGRRSASAGLAGGFVDISLIPLTAVERIEVLTDGASALYGSDAIGGVVNIILRRDYEGAESRARFASVTKGGQQEYQFGQVLGTGWATGNALLAYEYFRQEPLLSKDRAFAASSDLTPFGGDNFDRAGFGNPGTLIAGGQSFALPEGQDGRSLSPGDLVAGTANAQNLREGTSLLPLQKRHSVFASLSQDVADDLTAFLEGRFSRRATETRLTAFTRTLIVPASNPFFVDPVGGLPAVAVQYSFIDDLGPLRLAGDVEGYNVTAGLAAGVGHGWNLDGYAALDHQDTDSRDFRVNTLALDAALADPDPATAFNPFGDGSHTNPATLDAIRGFIDFGLKTRTRTINIKADGPLFALAGGDVKLAVGGEYRKDSFLSTRTTFTASPLPEPGPVSDLGRRIVAGFGEVVVPLFGPANRRTGFDKLEFSLAGRVEDYGDFGTTANPKLGALWSPLSGLDIRGSFGRSFRAPLLTEVDPSDLRIFATPFADPASPTGLSNVIILFGDNEDLQPERATTWTIGFDAAPKALPGLRLGFTLFSIDLKGRIEALNFVAALQREAEFAGLITRNPDPAVAQASLDDPLANDFGLGFTGADIDIILDARLNNIATTDIKGFDLTLEHTVETDRLGTFSSGLTGSYFFHFKDRFTDTSPVVDIVDTLGRQIDLRLRGHLSWSGDHVSASAYVNHSGAYRDDVSVPARRISSWTTLDVHLAYAFDAIAGLTLSLSANNILDADPPFINNRNGVGFDPANASPRGRFLAVQAGWKW